MARVEQARHDMFEDIYPLLLKFNNPSITEETWKRMFMNKWETEDEFPGLVLVDDTGKITGFMGTIFSGRELNGRYHRLCNLSSWIVEDEYRNESLKLLLPILKLKDYTFTNLTPLKHVSEIHLKLGFMILDDSYYLVPNIPYLYLGKGLEYQNEPNGIAHRLDDINKKLLDDHNMKGIRHFLVTKGKESCYIIYTIRHKSRLTLNHIHYISNKTFFMKQPTAIISALSKNSNAMLTILEERFIQSGGMPLANKRKWKSSRIFKSTVLDRYQVDNLYSELVMLNP